MQRLLINIRGTNGSGKSTVPRQMYALDDTKKVLDWGDTVITKFPKFKFIAVGTYHNKTGGMDSLKNTESMIKSIRYAVKIGEEFGYDVIAEGILASTVKSTYLTLFQSIHEAKPVVLFYTTPVDVCLKRIYQRNGGKPILESLVHNKYRTIMNQPEYFEENGIETHKIDNSNTPIDLMLPKFLKAVEKWRDL